MNSEILKHLRNYRNGSTKLRNILDIHDKIIKLKKDIDKVFLKVLLKVNLQKSGEKSKQILKQLMNYLRR
jgi:hypothetical protein